MGVTEILNGHRFLLFKPDGTFYKSAGEYGIAPNPTDAPGEFQFPNSIKFDGGSVYIMDSNNRRLQIYSRDAVFKGFVPMTGLPRGFTFLPRALTAAGASGVLKYVSIDTLAHNATIWDVKARELTTFGSQGVADGSFNYPDDAAMGDRYIIFVTDTMNQRVQAWGWQAVLSPIPHILPRQPLWLCGLPLLLLLLLPFRKRKKYATADFVQALYAGGQISLMQQKRVRWLVSEADYAKLEGLEQDEIKLSELLEGVGYSQTDAAELAVRYKLDVPTSAVLAFAQRAKTIHTEDAELKKLAKLLEVDTIDAAEFVLRNVQQASK
jgi:predicted nucleic acid-binding protein